MWRISAMPLALLLASPVHGDSPTNAVPTPLERALLQSLASETALKRAAEATGRPNEIARSGEIIEEILSETKRKVAPEIEDQSRTISNVRSQYGLQLSSDRLGALLVDADKGQRLAALQEATAETLTSEQLAEIDDELFWASFDPDRGDASQDFETKDGSKLRISTDPDTRDTTVEIVAEETEEGLPFKLALPTRWVVATEEPNLADDTGEDLMTVSDPVDKETEQEAQNTDDWGDDIFADVPIPQPVADKNHKPKILTPDMAANTLLQLNGLWTMGGFRFQEEATWFVTADIGTSNLIRPSKDQAQRDIDRLRGELSALREGGGTAFVWRNRETGEELSQERYKRLDIDTYEYLGEQSPGEELAELEQQIQYAEQRLKDGLDRINTTVAGFEQLSEQAGPIRVRVMGPCGGIMDAAWFDGLNLGVRNTWSRRCDMNPSLPEAVKSQLIGNIQTPWTAMFDIIPDPRSNLLIMRGNSWGGRVHYNQSSLKVTNQTGPHYYSAPWGERPIEDENTLLSDTAMGAEDNEAL